MFLCRIPERVGGSAIFCTKNEKAWVAVLLELMEDPPRSPGSVTLRAKTCSPTFPLVGVKLIRIESGVAGWAGETEKGAPVIDKLRRVEVVESVKGFTKLKPKGSVSWSMAVIEVK